MGILENLNVLEIVILQTNQNVQKNHKSNFRGEC